MTLEQRASQLRAIQAKVPEVLNRAARNATLRAIEKATELTPPTEGSLSGVNTRSGEMKAHWATDSRSTPQKRGESYVTELANNREYASYVNDGHRMDRHFVPGLVINGAGMLDYNPDGTGGIMVGTKTAYVPGLHMTDEAKKVYQDTLHAELRSLEELLR